MSGGLPVPGADTGGPIGRDGVETGAELIAGGLTGATLPESGSESGQDDSGDLRAKFDCPACMPEDLPYCDHRPEALPLARVLASHFQGVAEPSREQMGWFLDDAGSLLKDAGPGPYAVRKLGEGWHSEHAFLLNNLVVTIGEGGKDCPAQPEVAARLPEGHVLVRVSEDDDTTLAKALELLACVHDNEPCWFDHHGGCQAHGFLDLRPGEVCPQREIGELLAARAAIRALREEA